MSEFIIEMYELKFTSEQFAKTVLVDRDGTASFELFVLATAEQILKWEVEAATYV